jgi:hypothetical protein
MDLTFSQPWVDLEKHVFKTFNNLPGNKYPPNGSAAMQRIGSDTTAPFRFYMSKSATEFDTLVASAGSTSFIGLMMGIQKWMKNNKEARRLVSHGKLDQFLSRRLLVEVSLSRGFDVTEKIHGLVKTYGADVNFCGDGSSGNIVSFGCTPAKLRGVLALAVSDNQLESVGVLLSLGADPNARYHPWGENMFVSAVAENRVEIVKMLHKHGANLWQTDPMGCTAMERAVRSGHVELVEFFLKEGFSPNWFRVESRMTLLHYAVENKTKAGSTVVQLLIAAGANPHSRCFQPGEYDLDGVGDGYTPLQYLRHRRHGHGVWKNHTNDEQLRREGTHYCTVNESVLVDKMQANVQEIQLAVCMSTHDRLGSGNGCGLSSLSGEPGILRMIMQNACEKYDASHPLAPVSPWEVYTVP